MDRPPLEALTRLLEIALELGSKRDLDEILRIATTGVCGAVGCERASLFVCDDETHELRTRVVTELEISEIRHPRDKGIVGWVAQHQQLLSVAETALDARWDSSVDRKTGFRTSNILAAPVLTAERRLLGVLQLLNKPEGFSSLDETLVQAFAAHVGVALERWRLEAEADRALQLRHALEMGHQIQATFLPTKLPQIPGYDVAAWWQPAEFVSGDYYDWLPLADGRWVFAVGDVSGHGLAAALIMATVRAMTHVLVRTVADAPTFLATLRESLSHDLQDSRFVTFCYVVFDIAHHELQWGNAGHAPAFQYRAADESCLRLTSTATPLGFPVIELTHEPNRAHLEPGDLIVLATDGIIEVRDEQNEMFGQRRLEQFVRQNATLPAHDLVQLIGNEVQRFHGRAHPPDDATLVIIQRRRDGSYDGAGSAAA